MMLNRVPAKVHQISSQPRFSSSLGPVKAEPGSIPGWCEISAWVW